MFSPGADKCAPKGHAYSLGADFHRSVEDDMHDQMTCNDRLRPTNDLIEEGPFGTRVVRRLHWGLVNTRNIEFDVHLRMLRMSTPTWVSSTCASGV